MVYYISEEEYRKVVALLKNNKAAGRDDVLVEQLKHPGHKVAADNAWCCCLATPLTLASVGSLT